MKKTLTINISGVIFHIDEDAYEKLSRYLDKIKRHFTGFDGKDEVIADIEGRIAELLQGMTSDSKQVITAEDIDKIMAIMGEPSEFAGSDQTGVQGSAALEPGSQQKRLYRDTENKIFGGVCSGIASYFNINPLWIRIIFILLTFSGVTALLYVVLWLVVPEARTTAEKLEMRGEPVNVSNIEKSIKEEFGQIKDTFNGLTGKAKKAYSKKHSEHKKTRQEPLVHTMDPAIKAFVRLILILAGILLLIFGLSLGVALLATVFSTSGLPVFNTLYVQTFPLDAFFHLLSDNSSSIAIIRTGLLLVIGIPLFMLCVVGIRLIFDLKRSRIVGMIAGNIWLIAAILTAIFVIKLSNSFRHQEVVVQEKKLIMPVSKSINIDVRPIIKEDTYSFPHFIEINEWNMVLADDQKLFYGIPQLNIVKSPDSTFSIMELKKARGITTREAIKRAENIVYNYEQNDTSLAFDSYFTLPEDEVWKRQELSIELKVPVGTVIHFDDGIYRILRSYDRFEKHGMRGKSYIMTEDGLHEHLSGFFFPPKEDESHEIDRHIFPLQILIR
jgi:phage shock protein PspC (stress-responsive transcriptional regulator)